MAIKNLIVRGGADFSGLKKEMDKTQKSLSNFQSNIGGVMKKVGVALGSLAVGKLIKDSTAMAMGVESSMGNIERNMGSSAKSFQYWANTQSKALGIAKEDAYKYGGTFSNLLSSFTKNTKDTADQTTELMKAAAIIASKTGRSYEDTAERIRSGMLGSTEAIEDLGVYTNVSMIESTEAFKKFANGKSWAQLDFQVQQQIRLAAILEQTYGRYGNELANTTQTAHAQFIAGLKNVKLSIGEAFKPIYSFVLPALTALVDNVARAFNYISQFTKALFGNENSSKAQTKALDTQVAATNSLGKATSSLGKKSKKASKDMGSLASIDEINTNGRNSGSDDSDVGGGGLDGETPVIPMPILDGTEFEKSTTKISKKMEDMANKLRNSIKGIASFFTKYKDEIISALTGILGAIAAYEVLSNWTKILKLVKDIMTGISVALGTISLPIILIALAIGLLIGSLVYLWKTNEDFRNSVLEIWQEIKDFVVNVATEMWQIVKDVWDEYGATFIQNIKDFLNSIRAILDTIWESILKPIIGGALDMLKWLWDDHLKALVTEIMKFIMKLVNGALELWNKFFAPLIDFLIKMLGPAFVNTFKFILDVIGSTIAVISDIFKALIKIFGGIIDFIVGVFTGNWKKAWEGVKSVFSGVFEGLVDIVKYPINLIIDAVNFLIRKLNGISITFPDWIPGLGGKKWGINIPQIPKLAKGGIIDSPTLAMVGEAGKEAVIPLENNTQGIDLLADKLEQRMGGGIKNDRPIEITLELGGGQFARFMIDSINNLQLREGRTLLKI